MMAAFLSDVCLALSQFFGGATDSQDVVTTIVVAILAFFGFSG